VNRISLRCSIIILTAGVFLASCSNQKNTGLSRNFQGMVSHYNILFNGSESFKKGLKRIDENYKDDYSRILPVFNYGNDEIASTISSEMDVAIKKGSKVITLHSIKVKPKLKKGVAPTQQEKEFFNKNEFNRWVDDAYLLIGKAYFYKHDYPNAAATFSFINREFPKEDAHYEATIWLARVNNEIGEYRDAEILLVGLESDHRFPKKFKLGILTTRADLALKQNKYSPAIKSLEGALLLVHGKKLKLRYNYILAQLYQQTGQMEKATDCYTKVIKMNPPYEMTFNARINLAGSVEAGSKKTKYIQELLLKMLRDDKNKDFLDQIYYALGNIEMKGGNEAKAIEDYRESVKVSTTNTSQKALSCYTLGDYYFSHKDYVPAQGYYDSTLLYIDDKYPGVRELKSKAASLTRLVKNLNTIATEDSLQRVAKLSESDRIKLIDKIISNLRKKEADDQFAESQRMQALASSQSQLAAGQDKASQSKWYFYNPVSVMKGMKDFQLRWGKRKLEDNWRRRNKGVSAFGDSPELAAEAKGNDKKKALDNKSREYYTQHLPLTDSLRQISQKRLLEAYYNAGLVYRNELNDDPQSIALYEKFIDRYPGNTLELPSFYQLYGMNLEMKNDSRATYYKNLILSKYPDSNYAKVLTDPDFYKQIVEKEKEAGRYYEQSYQLYQDGQYQQVIANTQEAYSRYPKNDSVMAKFALLKALCIGKTANVLVFRNELNQVISKYPKNEVSRYAKDIIAYLNSYKPETKQAEDIKVAEVTYIAEEKPIYYLAIVVEKTEVLNQIVFDIINFDLDEFPNEKYELSNDDMGKSLKLVTVRSFATKEKAMTYFKAFTSPSAKPLTNVKGQTKIVFVISPANYQILQKQESADSYIQFFKLHFQ
jgi:tetratricopeptide (TPR) repeat protein